VLAAYGRRLVLLRLNFNPATMPFALGRVPSARPEPTAAGCSSSFLTAYASRHGSRSSRSRRSPGGSWSLAGGPPAPDRRRASRPHDKSRGWRGWSGKPTSPRADRPAGKGPRHTNRNRQRNGVAVSRTSGPMRTTSSRRKRLASAMLGAPGPASAALPPPPIRTGAM
jgi:hypothetical protein